MALYTVEMEVKIEAQDAREASELALYKLRANYPVLDICITCEPYSNEGEE